ncbi:MAG TPA: LuxR C-terminal-related transcriptional regulator, partial [Chitinophagaceae bacterium]|nr:LuxR C-terminal-related transcriptional regulator [Chitinophagaceae bacterium]
VFYELKNLQQPAIVIFEDIHWADEATLDFIKFLSRRITQLECLFILTYRDNEIRSSHPLRNILGQLNPDSFMRMQLLPLSKGAVEKLAQEKGYNGADVYKITGGNPFYVNEIMAHYSRGVPDSIKDSVLAAYNLTEPKTREVWDLVSVIPTAIEIKYLEKLEPQYANAIEVCIDRQILFDNEGIISFKHELFRTTVETSLSPLKRILLHKKILELLREDFEKDGHVERILHHAKNANEYELVAHYAPIAAKQAARVGAHIEAAKLYLTAIEYYQENDKDVLIQFYEAYSYECYLTNQIKDAIIYAGKSLNILKEKNDIERTGDSMRFLSRLWWFDGNRKKAEDYAMKAIEILSNQPASKAKAMALSNMSQLQMLSDHPDECIVWGEQAIAMAKELNDDEILAHALNNVGDVYMRHPSSTQKGIELLQQSLDIALKNSYHEHAARAYTNIGSSAVVIKDYAYAKEVLDTGIQYCEERDLDSWYRYMLSDKAKLNVRTGNWDEALRISNNLIEKENQAAVIKIGALAAAATIKMRRGDDDVLPLLKEAQKLAFATRELQRIIPVMAASLEYEWLTGSKIIDDEEINYTIETVRQMGNVYDNSEFDYWLLKARNKQIELREYYEPYKLPNKTEAQKTAAVWEQLNSPYEQALALFEGREDDKRNAITIIQKLGANAVYEKLKLQMRSSGIKSIPRGARKSTQLNPALLTNRELDILQLLKEGLQNKEIADKLFISPKTVDHHISSIFYKLEVNSRAKAVQEATRQAILK